MRLSRPESTRHGYDAVRRTRRVMSGACACVLLAVSTALPVHAQEAERPVRWVLEAERAEAANWNARLLARIDDGWYLYSPLQPAGGPIALEIGVAGSGFELAGEIAVPRPRRYADRNFNIFSQIYQTAAAFGLPVQRAGAGDGVLVVLARYQACTTTYCLPPRTDTVRLELEPPVPVATAAAPGAGAAAVAAPLAAAAAPDTSQRAASAALAGVPQPAPDQDDGFGAGERDDHGGAATATSEGDGLSTAAIPVSTAEEAGGGLLFGATSFGAADSLARFLWLAALMGFLSLLTPCVFPMVPITVGFFTRSSGSSQGAALLRAGAYGAGIIATFSALGLGVAVLFGAGGVVRLAANPWLNLAVGAMFVAFALNLLGVYEVRLPRALVARAATAGSAQRGAGPAFAMGGAFTLTSFTCTAPFVGTLLVLATQGSWQWPLLGLTVYAAAFALPFFLLALMPDALSRLPRSGPWLHTLKATLGVVEIAAAAKFLSNADLVWKWGVLTREVVIAVWIAAALVLVAIFAAHAWRALRAAAAPASVAARSAVPPAGARRAVAWKAIYAPAALAIVALTLSLHLTQGLRGERLGELEAFLPPPGEGRALGGGELPWRLNDFDGSLALARAEGRPLLLDFTGYTCTNCRWMEANMFPRTEVRELLDGFVRVRLYTDGQGAVYERQQQFQQQRFGTVALPYYAVVDPAGRPVAAFLGMTRDAREFTRFLRAAGSAAHEGSM